MKYSNQILPVLVILLACFASRIPMLTSPYMLLDGDECVVGLMAKHLYAGKAFPLYFYGQRYGLSIIEELCIVPFYAVFGVTALSVKLAMLSLWSVGVVFIYKTLQQLNTKNKDAPVLLIALLIVCPAWTEWSMKARGGYVTAFTLSAIVSWMLCKKKELSLGQYILIGVLLVLVYESMLLWVPAIVLLFVYRLSKEYKNIKWLVTPVIFLAGYFVFAYYKRSLYQYHEPDKILPISEWGHNISRIPEFLYTSLHGYHYFFNSLQPGFFQQAFAISFLMLVVLGIVTGIILIVRSKQIDWILVVFTLPVIGSILITIITPDTNYRFLLPVTVSVLLLIQVIINRISTTNKLMPVAGVMIILGMASLITFRDYKFTIIREKPLLQFVEYLEKRDIKYTFSCHVYLPWQVLFYSNEKVLSRDVSKWGRVPEYHKQINAALRSGKKTAFIGLSNDYYGMDIKSPVYIDSMFVQEDLPESELTKNFTMD